MASTLQQLVGLSGGAVTVYYYFALMMQATGWSWSGVAGGTIVAIVSAIYCIVWVDSVWNKEVRAAALPRSQCGPLATLLTPTVPCNPPARA